MTDTRDFGVAYLAFLKRAQEVCEQTHHADGFLPPVFPPRLSGEGGPRYIRIVAASYANDSDRRAFCFIARDTGDVFKPKGWKGPEKNFARGNIFDAQNG